MPTKKEQPTKPALDELFKQSPTDKPAEPEPPAEEERQTGESPSAPEPAPQPQTEQPPAPQPAPSSGPLVKREPLPFYPTNTDEMWRYATMLAKSKLLPAAFYPKGDWGKTMCNIADVHVVLMKGHDLGLKPMQSLSSINVIDGKAEIGATLMIALIMKSGACASWKLVHSDDRRAVYKTKRIGDDEWTEFEYTIEEAEQMGLLDKGRTEEAKAKNQWRLQPRTMLRRRCQTNLAREVYPDIVLGLYDTDELSEIREVAERLGLRDDQVAGAIETTGTQAALPEPTTGPIARVVASKVADPLKARMAAKVAGSRVKRCSVCDSQLDPRDDDPCIACRTEPTPTTEAK